MAEVRHVPATVHGRYLVERPAGEPVGLLVGFHGYGETAEAHLSELGKIPGSGDWLRVGVEALHPFYTRSGEVVGNWMTRRDRELAIADNVAYAATVVERVVSEEEVAEPLVFVGFSQGVAMAYRAAAGAGRPCHGVIALAGDVPPDVADGSLDGFPPVLVGRGTGDEWYGGEKLRRDLETLAAHGVPARSLEFEGGHVWTPEFHRAAGEFLRSVRPTTRTPG